MDDQTWAMLGIASMGLGGAVSGLVGVVLPERRRLGALFALISGAGVGLAVLAFGAIRRAPAEPSGFTLFVASLAGLVTVIAACAVVMRRAASERSTDPRGEG